MTLSAVLDQMNLLLSGGRLFSISIAFVPSLLNLSIVVYILYRLPKNTTTRIFMFFVMALFFWQMSDLTIRICETEASARFWDKFYCASWMMVGPLALSFSAHHTQNGILTSRAGFILLFVPFVFFHSIYVSIPTPVQFVQHDLWGWINQPREGTLDGIQRIWVSTLVIISLVILFFHAYKNRNHRELKLQSLIIAIGMLIPTIQGITTQVIFPVFKLESEVPITSSTLTVFSLATIVAFRKYRLFSISDSLDIKSVFNNLTDIVIILDLQQKAVFFNPYSKSLLGIQDENMADWQIESLFHEKSEYNRFKEEAIEKTLNYRRIRNLEYTFQIKQGEKIDVILSTELITNNSIVEGVMIVARDITDRKRLFQIIELENKIFSSSREGMTQNELIHQYLTEVEQLFQHGFCSVLYFHHATENKFVFSQTPGLSDNDKKSFVNLSNGLFNNLIQSALESRSLQVITENRLNETEIIPEWVLKNKIREIFALPIISSQGEILGVFVLCGKSLHNNETLTELAGRIVNIIRIILEREQSISHIDNQRRIYMDLVNTIDGIVYELDLVENKFEFVSNRAENMLGFPLSDWYNESTSPFNSIHPDDLIHVQNTIANLNGQSHLELEYRVRNASGKYLWMRDYIRVFYKEGKPLKFQGIMVNTDQLKQIENEREKVAVNLLNRNKDLEQFTYIISHNLRAPMANIIGYSSALISANETDNLAEIAQNIYTSANRLDGVIRDLNTMLSIRKGKEPPQTVNLKTLLGDLIQSVQANNKNNYKITLNIENIPEIQTIPSYISSIFENLISNAIKYRSSVRSGELQIHGSDEEDKAILTFQDNGIGIDMDLYGNDVFGMYKRFHNHVDGNGLGLFMVKAQTEAIGGEISIQSEVDKGTTFTLVIPKNFDRKEYGISLN